MTTYFAFGVAFGFVLLRAEVISWFRIQEMFRFQSFHMYGIIGSAIAVAALSLALIRKMDVRTRTGEMIVIVPKTMGSGARYLLGGTCFGVGWALTGACPGPLAALLGSGIGTISIAILSALAGTWTYGYLRPRLPH